MKIEHCGAYIFVFATIQFIVAMIAVQLAYPCASYCYSILTNPISDLGNTSTSTLPYVFSASLVLFGILLITGVVMLRLAFTKSRTLTIAIALLAISALGAMGVGLVPENVDLGLHSAFAATAFFFGGLSLIAFGVNEHGAKGRKRYSYYSMISGAITVALFLIAVFVLTGLPKSGPGFGFGGLERLIVAPVLLWTIITGIRFHK